MKIRNIAIIAHVDHGKTTLVDQLLKKSNTLANREQIEDRAMDSNALERERGITILSKNTAISYLDYKINILDTPGHADFSGEVERIMKMVEGVLLVVDAFEGIMPQTRFVLKQALEANLKPIVVINKIDRENARPEVVLDQVLDLFIELGATDEQADFKVVYLSALKGTSSLNSDPKTQVNNMDPLLDMIIAEIPEPNVDEKGTLQFQGSLLDYNEYLGRIAIGRITRGIVYKNNMVTCLKNDGTKKDFRILKLFSFMGLQKIEVDSAKAGDIVAIAGLPDINVGETICEVGYEEPLPPLKISEPTVQMYFGVNKSPFAGQEGKHVTSTKLDERLFREVQKDVSLKVERLGAGEEWVVSGRGELHLGILIENMRREGYEFLVSKPKPILKTIDDVEMEPYEYTIVDVPNDFVGASIELFGFRGGIIINMETSETHTRLHYHIPSRGLIGVVNEFLTATKGYGTISHNFLDYRKIESLSVGQRKAGVLVASETGKATTYGISQIEERGILFVLPNDSVYEGQIVGESNREEDLAVNIVKNKQQTNMRSSNKDSTIVLKRPRKMGLETCLEYLNEDELLEVTPRSVRLRKRILNTNERKKYDSRKQRDKV